MALVTPDIGLIIWQLVVFVIVLIVLRAFVWIPILSALKTREYQIEDSLREAANAREEMEHIKADNEYLLQEARIERDAMMKEAKKEADRIIEHAKAETSEITAKMLHEAREAIEFERRGAVEEIKNQVATLSLEIAEKVIRQQLANEESQKTLVKKFIEESKVN